MDNKICCFAGHNQNYTDLEREMIRNEIIDLIENYGITTFWVGNYGGFDRICSSILNEIKKDFPEIEIVLVIPYLTKSITENKNWYLRQYDGIINSNIPNTPKRYQIIKTNEYMINNSYAIICYVSHTWVPTVETTAIRFPRSSVTLIS